MDAGRAQAISERRGFRGRIQALPPHKAARGASRLAFRIPHSALESIQHPDGRQGFDQTMIIPFPHDFLVAGDFEDMGAFAFLAAEKIADDKVPIQ